MEAGSPARRALHDVAGRKENTRPPSDHSVLVAIERGVQSLRNERDDEREAELVELAAELDAAERRAEAAQAREALAHEAAEALKEESHSAAQRAAEAAEALWRCADDADHRVAGVEAALGTALQRLAAADAELHYLREVTRLSPRRRRPSAVAGSAQVLVSLTVALAALAVALLSSLPGTTNPTTASALDGVGFSSFDACVDAARRSSGGGFMPRPSLLVVPPAGLEVGEDIAANAMRREARSIPRNRQWSSSRTRPEPEGFEFRLRDGSITGSGEDSVGAFAVVGACNAVDRQCTLWRYYPRAAAGVRFAAASAPLPGGGISLNGHWDDGAGSGSFRLCAFDGAAVQVYR